MLDIKAELLGAIQKVVPQLASSKDIGEAVKLLDAMHVTCQDEAFTAFVAETKKLHETREQEEKTKDLLEAIATFEAGGDLFNVAWASLRDTEISNEVHHLKTVAVLSVSTRLIL